MKANSMADDELGAVLNCAVRYCLGRRTYMPELVTNWIRRHPETINERTRSVMVRDIEEAEKDNCLGDPNVDAPMWRMFLTWLKEGNE